MFSDRATIWDSVKLVDHDGQSVSLSTYRGELLLVFFGFTHCRVVCPRALGRISTALERLGPVGAAIRPLYITVDPARDTPATMRLFLETNYPRFTGLTGTQENLVELQRAFRVFVARVENHAASDGIEFRHSAISYLLDREGHYLEHFPDVIDDKQMAQRLLNVIERQTERPSDV
ncbi:MAG TPA: SCO family protein [Rhizomicrobium sp.]|nr:SCO family protein [Rhizomicrobium sp.]